MLRTTSRVATLAALAMAGGAALAGPAFAAGGPVSANVTVPSTLVFAFTSATTFTVPAGGTAPAAVSFTVATNDASGYTVNQSGADLSDGNGHTLAAGTLSDVLNYHDTDGAGSLPAVLLTNNPATFATSHTPSMTPVDSYSQDWSAASLPGNTPPGNYATTINYVVAGA